jgi:ATP-dependent DNA helicase DinG
MRQRAAESDVVIVNHHLLCADASVRKGNFGEVIPGCTSLVVDERTSSKTSPRSTSACRSAPTRFDDFVRDADRGLSEARATDR